jgi:peroxiredoxin Q/BCP
LRDDYAEFERRHVAVLAIAPHSLAEATEVAAELELPFPVLADETRQVFLTYDVQSKVWSLGQRPAVFLIDPSGTIRWAHQGTQQWDIPENSAVLAALDRLIARDLLTTERRR